MAKILQRTISWDPSPATDVVGYNLYWAVGADAVVDYLSDHANVGNKTNVVIPDDVAEFPLVEDVMSLGVTAFDDIGNESDMTSVQNVPFDFVAPDAPTNLVVGTL